MLGSTVRGNPVMLMYMLASATLVLLMLRP